MGVAGASFSQHTVLITGLAGLLAGACSMAMGEWLSVQSARELYAKEIATEADEIAEVPDEEQEELELIYRASRRSGARALSRSRSHAQGSEPRLARSRSRGARAEGSGAVPWGGRYATTRMDSASLNAHVRSDVNTTRALTRKNRQIPCV
jgi:VIT1/CCC1 family predicted Fe2+/Mn2+ transporter